MKTDRVVWTLDDARVFIDKVRAAIQPAGWEVGLTGSVLQRGSSGKDLDLILYPHQKTGPLGIDALRTALRTVPLFKPHVSVEAVQAFWRKKGSLDQKHVEVWQYRSCRRVDLMILS